VLSSFTICGQEKRKNQFAIHDKDMERARTRGSEKEGERASLTKTGAEIVFGSL
jgi:hypothetical protein